MHCNDVKKKKERSQHYNSFICNCPTVDITQTCLLVCLIPFYWLHAVIQKKTVVMTVFAFSCMKATWTPKIHPKGKMTNLALKGNYILLF